MATKTKTINQRITDDLNTSIETILTTQNKKLGVTLTRPQIIEMILRAGVEALSPTLEELEDD